MVFFKAAVQSTEGFLYVTDSVCCLFVVCCLSVVFPGSFRALRLVHAVHAGYIAWVLIGQNKSALRSPVGLSRVSHPQVSVYKCTEAGIKNSIPAPSKVCALTDSTKVTQSLVLAWVSLVEIAKCEETPF